jgi:CRISPR-associated protein Csb1
MGVDELYQKVLGACGRRSKIGAIRVVAEYEPAGGIGSRVSPPTYPDVGYLFERRHVDGEVRKVVALDSVQSQANRLEEALLGAAEEGDITLPYLEVSTDIGDQRFRVTSLDAPHRSPDAYFRDSVDADGVPFDKSTIGQRLRSATGHNARAYFEYAPTDLLLGIWDSQRGGRGLRLPRAYTSETVALDPEVGQRAAGRLDPYNMTHAGGIVVDKADPANWAFNQKELDGEAKGKPAGRLSEINHGNALSGVDKTPGGVSVTSITRTAVLSFGVLNRLRFPSGDDASSAVDAAGRAVLAALGLVGDRLAFSGASTFLRSGCDLVLASERLEWVLSGEKPEAFHLDDDTALELLSLAIEKSNELGLSFHDAVIALSPSANLEALIGLNIGRLPSDEG